MRALLIELGEDFNGYRMKQLGGGFATDKSKGVELEKQLLLRKKVLKNIAFLADVNGSYNIMRKALPNVFQDNGIGDANGVLAPLVVLTSRIVVPLRTQKSRKR